jgi:hypothetical protein
MTSFSYLYSASYRWEYQHPEHTYVGRHHRHVIEQEQMKRGTRCSHRGQTHERQKGIHTDRSNNLLEGLVPMTYPCPQSFSWLVQVPAITCDIIIFAKLSPSRGFPVWHNIFLFHYYYRLWQCDWCGTRGTKLFQSHKWEYMILPWCGTRGTKVLTTPGLHLCIYD